MLFANPGSKVRYGVLVDIGSGSVLVAIIKSDPQLAYPQIIWVEREFVPLRHSESLTASAKHVMVSLMNALMRLDGEGMKALETLSKSRQVLEVQITIAAPWSYTVTKEISYSHSSDFTVSQKLVDELLRTANTKLSEEIASQEKIQQLGLSVVTKTTIGLLANGYEISEPADQTAKTLKVIQANVVAQDYLIKTVAESLEKIMPRATARLYSFMLVYYSVIRQLQPELTEYCLVDITYEATELGVIRNGILQHTTHTPFGVFSIARELANVLSVPLEEAFGYLHTPDPMAALEKYTAEKRSEVKEIFDSYEAKLVELFKETGDSLSIPKKIFIHGNLRNEEFFMKRIDDAAEKATRSDHATYPTSFELITKFYPEELSDRLRKSQQDTALLISAQFFHTPGQHTKFEHY